MLLNPFRQRTADRHDNARGWHDNLRYMLGAKEELVLLLIGGLSGAGKSTLGRHLHMHCDYEWIELDDPNGKDQFCTLGIVADWEEFAKGNPGRLVGRFPSNTVLTIDSTKIVRSPAYMNDDCIRVRYLFGPEKKCFDRAHKRDPELVTQARWDHFNKEMLAYLNSEDCPAVWKIYVFEENGAPKSVDELARLLST